MEPQRPQARCPLKAFSDNNINDQYIIMKIVIIRNRIQTFDSRLGVRTYELLQLSSRPGFLYTRVSLERGLTCETKRDVATRSSEALSRRSRTPARCHDREWLYFQAKVSK